MLCENAGHDDRCMATCVASAGDCSVGRKHFARGGVCCVTCFAACVGCGGYFYHEHLAGGRCHCCTARAARPEG